MSTLKEIIEDPSTLLVDVRSPWEFELEHLSGAKNIPLEEIPSKMEEFKTVTNPVVFYCRSGSRSRMAVTILQQNGMANVFNGGAISDLQILLN